MPTLPNFAYLASFALALCHFSASGQVVPAGPGAAPAASDGARDEKPAPVPALDVVPASGTSARVEGDPAVRATLNKEGHYEIAGTQFRQSAPLPDGYPAPTPPGMMEIKSYPSVRRAEIDSRGPAGLAMNASFFPLFNHIKGRGIPMTAPVEVDIVRDADAKATQLPQDGTGKWKMSFLYRTAKLGETGKDGKVVVADAKPVTVISCAIDTWFTEKAAQGALDRIEKWMDAQTRWEIAGQPRALNYSGPGDMPWTEIQIPVRLRAAAPEVPPAQTPAEAPAKPAK
ncbi:MAG: hypothetical protein WC718_14290 [Phycisphaerales bacterium]|jgi:hypothetical protein